MTKASDNLFPKVILEERLTDGSDTATPAADHRAAFLGEDGSLYLKDSAGTVTAVGGAGGAVATDAIWDAAGDLAVGSGANTAARLAAGSEGRVLTIASGVPAWADATSRPYLDRFSNPLDGTYGDDFDEGSLNARWTRINITSGMETYQSGDGSHLRVGISSATVPQLYSQPAPAAGTDFDFVCSFTVYTRTLATMYGLFAITSAGAGRGPLAYISDSKTYHGILTSYGYTSAAAGNVVLLGSNGRRIWHRLTRVGTTYTAYTSADGINWNNGVAATDAATMDRIAIGRVLGADTTDIWCIDRFDRVS